MKRTLLVIFSLLLVAGGFFIFQKERDERYAGQSFIPERSKDVPLYKGLSPEGSPEYVIEGDHWEEILAFYKKVLPENGWEEVYIQSSDNHNEDGAGFMSSWHKKGQQWELYIGAGYFRNQNQTEVIFDKRERMTASAWIEKQPESICINEQPERSKDCFKITDKKTISEIISLINGAFDQNKEWTPYEGKSTIEAGSFLIEVYYDLDKGIYLVSDKGTKWMKPEKEFFESTRISKEY